MGGESRNYCSKVDLCRTSLKERMDRRHAAMRTYIEIKRHENYFYLWRIHVLWLFPSGCTLDRSTAKGRGEDGPGVVQMTFGLSLSLWGVSHGSDSLMVALVALVSGVITLWYCWENVPDTFVRLSNEVELCIVRSRNVCLLGCMSSDVLWDVWVVVKSKLLSKVVFSC